MKYIRTKDGRILDLSLFSTVVAITKEDIIGRADTIEELCDWIVFKENGSIKVLYKNFWLAVKYEGNDLLRYNEVYGAIENDKGLIYVAKMNEKGALELL